jgi:hypothetical protein
LGGCVTQALAVFIRFTTLDDLRNDLISAA